MTRPPLLSIVMPTRNRGDYARPAITSLMQLSSPDVEFVIEDNSTAPELADWIAHIADDRVSYRHSSDQRSMSGNYHEALSRATGEYITFIGDDDSVNPEIVDATRWARALALDALVPTTPAAYVWPDLELGGAAPAPGELRVYAFDGRIWYPHAEQELVRCVSAAGLSFADLPKIYYGIVRRELAERVRTQTGVYFPGLSPDLAGAVAIAQHARSVCKVDYPLFVPGSSARSNAGLGGRGQHIGLLRDQPHLGSDVEARWSAVVPRFYSVETVWAEALVQSLIATGREDLLRSFNVGRLYAHCLTWHPRYVRYILPAMRSAFAATGRSTLLGIGEFGIEMARLWALRAKFLLLRLRPRRQATTVLRRVTDLADVAAASTTLVRLLRDDLAMEMPWHSSVVRG